MLDLICPICGQPLHRDERTYRCAKRHSYDMARSGYVNLLPPSPGGKRHGDDVRMVAARTAFLSAGYYDHLQLAVAALADALCANGGAVVDAGCGEGAYTKRVYDRLAVSGKAPQMVGIDISVAALRHAARLLPQGIFCAASTASMPLADNSADLILNIFSPFMADEFRRVLRPGGHLIRVVPMARHLWELKAAVYDTPYENPPTPLDADGFAIVRQQALRQEMYLPTQQAVQDLFQMTPYYYKTGAADQRKLEQVSSLRVTTEFEIAVYAKK